MRYRLDDQPVLTFGLQMRPSTASALEGVAYFGGGSARRSREHFREFGFNSVGRGVLTVLLGVE